MLSLSYEWQAASAKSPVESSVQTNRIAGAFVIVRAGYVDRYALFVRISGIERRTSALVTPGQIMTIGIESADRFPLKRRALIDVFARPRSLVAQKSLFANARALDAFAHAFFVGPAAAAVRTIRSLFGFALDASLQRVTSESGRAFASEGTDQILADCVFSAGWTVSVSALVDIDAAGRIDGGAGKTVFADAHGFVVD
jgi:hypothetical protein